MAAQNFVPPETMSRRLRLAQIDALVSDRRAGWATLNLPVSIDNSRCIWPPESTLEHYGDRTLL